jgi:hypothetical protein
MEDYLKTTDKDSVSSASLQENINSPARTSKSVLLSSTPFAY